MNNIKTKVGLIGCGAVSNMYFEGCARYENIEIVACASLDRPQAEAKALEHGIRCSSVEELLADSGIQIVLNLTVPTAHADVDCAALNAGKHVYSEKPIGIDREECRRVLSLAKQKKLRVGCAPDTFLGGGAQTARKLIDDGAIGQPIGGVAFLCGHGPESWHLSPDFFYAKGGGPMFDMGPYYITALISLLGPIKRVTGSAQASFPTRTVPSGPNMGKVLTVRTPTHVAGIMEFVSGAVVTIIQSFDVWTHSLPILEIYGSEASLGLPDPNCFLGPVKIGRPGKAWEEVVLTHRTDLGRGSGLADMANAISTSQAHRANGELAFHVLDVMSAFEEASVQGQHIELSSTCERPMALPAGLAPGQAGR